MSGKSWEKYILEALGKNEDAFADAIMAIQKNIDMFIKEK